MGAPPVPRAAAGRPARRVTADAVVRAFLTRAVAKGDARPVGTFPHRTYVLPLSEPLAGLLNRPPGTPVTVRLRPADAPPLAIRTWDGEREILRAVRRALPDVPECLAEGDGYTVHSHVDGGTPLARLCADGKPVGALYLTAVADLFATLVQVRGTALPPLPPAWPRNHTDSQAFLRTLAHLADRQVRRPNWPRFGGLFTALGIPEDALIRLAGRVPAMARRPYSLLHGDLHRHNLLVPPGGEPSLLPVGWEPAGYGDPLHDLAVHLVRMRYPDHQRDEVVDTWADAVRRVRPAAVHGLARDLPHYLAFERAQSVYPGVIRAAQSLADSLDEQSLDRATAAVHGALTAAAGPLGLGRVPGEPEIERVLLRWRTSAWAAPATSNGPAPGTRTGTSNGPAPATSDGPAPATRTSTSDAPAPGTRTGTSNGPAPGTITVRWRPDRRVPEHPDFPHRAVHDALLREGAAPADRVFKGTAHLNSVLQVPGVPFPVVVRRLLPGVTRRERGPLSEHAVLRAIERSGAAVAAPRVLALGESHVPDLPGARAHPGDRFTIHTYEGPRDPGRGPAHPVGGLLPHEADGLVDQLAALTEVDHVQVDPVAGRLGFYHWLSDQLVALVDGLPAESRRLARFLGLPGPHRLREILARHDVTPRAPALLHGDLNPWNLVRRDGALALTLIDWEMALVGDPLYDLVRHMHLTPTRPEIRDRMFRRWERTLPAGHTRDWRHDWRVYRWIEIVRSAYVDLDRLVTGAGLDAPNVRRALESYAMTLAAATASLGLAAPRRNQPHPLWPAGARHATPGGP
ncbi:phosphotransferase [Streptomyces sp. L2]|uniref:phosphotransferase n=1 Tax=Streptomyces sp. L2 TaxID=2162665 RepID=UPI0019D6BBC0|nr:phosphotransferase [Streptomyces sp. L2]